MCLAQVRGNDLSPANCKDCYNGYNLIDTCHVLGSRGLLIDDQIYYTADISTRQRGFMGSAQIPRAEILIVESTFGLPKYVFPPVYDVMHMTNKIIGEMFDRGVGDTWDILLAKLSCSPNCFSTGHHSLFMIQ